MLTIDLRSGRVIQPVGNPVDDFGVANKQYVDTLIGSGGNDQPLNTTDDVTFNTVTITVPPTNDTDASTKGYVDGLATSFNYGGWGNYSDDITAPATIVIGTSPVKLTINGLGGITNTSYLPLAIRGSGDLWDTINNKITPINIGDSYIIRIDLQITNETGNPTELRLQLDIGGGVTPTIVVVNRYITTGKAAPYNISIAFPIFTLNTFVTNGGQLFAGTDTGTVTIGSRNIFISATSSGLL